MVWLSSPCTPSLVFPLLCLHSLSLPLFFNKDTIHIGWEPTQCHFKWIPFVKAEFFQIMSHPGAVEVRWLRRSFWRRYSSVHLKALSQSQGPGKQSASPFSRSTSISAELCARRRTVSFCSVSTHGPQLHIQLWRQVAELFSWNIINIVTLRHMSATGCCRSAA